MSKQNSHSWILVSSIMKSRILVAPYETLIKPEIRVIPEFRKKRHLFSQLAVNWLYIKKRCTPLDGAFLPNTTNTVNKRRFFSIFFPL